MMMSVIMLYAVLCHFYPCLSMFVFMQIYVSFMQVYVPVMRVRQFYARFMSGLWRSHEGFPHKH